MNEEWIIYGYSPEAIYSSSVIMLLFLGFAAFYLPKILKDVEFTKASKVYIATLAIPLGCFIALLHETSSVLISDREIVFKQLWGDTRYSLSEVTAINLRWEKTSKNGLVDNYYLMLADGSEVPLNFHRYLIQHAWPDIKYQARTQGVIISDPPRPVIKCGCRSAI